MGTGAIARHNFLQGMRDILPPLARQEKEWANQLQAVADHAQKCGLCGPGYVCPTYQEALEKVFNDPRLNVPRPCASSCCAG